MGNFNIKDSANYKELSRRLKLLVLDVESVFKLNHDSAINWLKLENLAFKGLPPINMYTSGKGNEVEIYIKKIKEQKK